MSSSHRAVAFSVEAATARCTADATTSSAMMTTGFPIAAAITDAAPKHAIKSSTATPGPPVSTATVTTTTATAVPATSPNDLTLSLSIHRPRFIAARVVLLN
ncbi:hypothetical protein [Herbiconiux sp. VKM Ac-1786]|uniref:hypothetical protein n=1 Tax=Herbiconiux sp. VKM Ac-1786 TaxID=2783824 RepID=UPI00351C370A